MVTKMKMFGFLDSHQNNNQKTNNVVQGPDQIKKNQFRSVSSQFNLASIMKMQSTGCKSCRGWNIVVGIITSLVRNKIKKNKNIIIITFL